MIDKPRCGQTEKRIAGIGKRILLGWAVLTLVALPHRSVAQQVDPEWPKLVMAGGKCGLLNSDGKFLVNPQYDWLGSRDKQGYSLFYRDGKFGYLGRDGQVAIAPSFDAAGRFDESGLALVRVNELWGFIGTDGNFRIRPQFTEAAPFGTQDLTPARTTDPARDRAARRAARGSRGSGPFGFIDKTGRFAIAPRFYGVGTFDSSGLARVAASTHEQGMPANWGYIDRSGRFVIDPIFEEARAFDETGLAAVNFSGTAAYNPAADPPYSSVNSGYGSGTWGYIDRQGKVVIPPRFTIAKRFDRRGLAFVRAGWERINSGFIDRSGRIVVPFREQVLPEPDNQDLLPVRDNSDRWGYVNRAGRLVIPARYEWAWSFDESGLARVRQNGKVNFINMRGVLAFRSGFEVAPPFGRSNLTIFMRDGQFGIMNRQGETTSRIEASIDRLGCYPGSLARDEVTERNFRPAVDSREIHEIEFDYRRLRF